MKKFLLVIFCLFINVLLYSQELYKLDNGLTVILQEDHKVPLATFQIWVKTGSIYEVEYTGAGISHYVEHLLFTDTKKRTGIEIAELMKEYGCDMNGYTSFEKTVYHFTLPSENLFKIIPVVKEMIFEPGFKQEQIDKERNVILKEINMNVDDPGRFFSRLIFSSSYERAFYKYPVIGYREIFENVVREDIINYYNKNYITDKMAVIVVGDFDKEELKQNINTHFNIIKRKFISPVNILDEPLQTGYKEIVRYRKDIRIPKIALAWKTVDIHHKDLFALDVFSLILGRGKTSLLNLDLKEDNNYVSQIMSFSYTPEKKGIFVVEAELNPGVEPDFIKEKIINIITNIKEKISDEKLEKIKLIALKEYYKDKETINSQASDLGINWVSTGNIFFSKYYVTGLRKVTKDQVITVVKKYFYSDNLSFIKVLPEELRKKDSIQSAKIEKNKTVTEKLDNGLRVILNRNNDLPFINISLVFKGGVLFEPADKKGLTHFLSKMLLAGTDNKSKEEILSAIEDKGGTINTFAGNNSFGITIEIFKQDFSECVGIIKDILINSKFSEKEIKKVKIEVLQEIKAIDEKIFGIGKKILFKEMYDGYDYSSLNVGNEKSIQNIKKEDLKKHYSKLVVPANGVLSISGDISLSRIKEELDESLNKWTRKKKKLKEKEFLNLGYIIEKQVEAEIDKTQSLLFIAYYGLSVRNDDRIIAELLWHILNGQGSRLFTNLREKKELAYYTGMFPFYGLTTGLFVFYVGTVKDKLKLAQEGILEEVNNIIKNGITEKELNAGKQEFLSEKIKAFQANSSIAFDYALEELYNNRILNITDYKKMLDEIDLKSINKFIQSYFSDKPYKVIILKGK